MGNFLFEFFFAAVWESEKREKSTQKDNDDIQFVEGKF